MFQDEDIREGPCFRPERGGCEGCIHQRLRALQQGLCEIDGGCSREEELALRAA